MDIDEVYNIIGKNIRFYRMNNLKYGYLSQESLSRICMVSISIIRNMEAKRKNNIINLVAINNIAKALDVPLYKFFLKDS
ncbi:MAG: hypothetical protein HFI36_07425 [Bacilli bacterium]|jgi:transcriptional regulator with XRE-family HTH domain|nr:hypothetical protein [Bacilli bacterium]MCX4254867.1 hypothetical protein [Bacilli bacterium]